MGEDIENIIQECIEPEEEQTSWEKFFREYGTVIEKFDCEELIKYGIKYSDMTDVLINITKQICIYYGCNVSWWFKRVIEIYDQFDIDIKAKEYEKLIMRVNENRKFWGL